MTEEEQYLHDHKMLRETGFFGSAGAGCIFYAKATGRVCLSFRSALVLQPRTWGTWGGAIAEGEDFYDAARREVQEEAGFDGHYELIPAYVFQKGDFRYANFIAVVEEEFTPDLDWETEAFAWFDLADVMTMMVQPLHFGLYALLTDQPTRDILRHL